LSAIFNRACVAEPVLQPVAFIGPAGVQVAVVFLGRGDQGDQVVQVLFELGVRLDAQRVRGALENLVGVGIVERITAPVLAFFEAAGDGEVVHAPVLFALAERAYGIVTVRFVSIRGAQNVSLSLTSVNGTGRIG